MKIYSNGVLRDLTQEEMANIEKANAEMQKMMKMFSDPKKMKRMRFPF